MEGKFQPFSVKKDNIIYNCTQFLGEGSFGKVFECNQKGINQSLAIKVLTPKTQKNTESVEKEIYFMKQIQNFQHVIQFIDSFKEQKTYYIVTEFMAGGNLGQFINRNIYLSQEQSAKFLRQIGLGIYEIHLRGIIHRDLKPENILLSSKNQNIILKVTDFGLSNQQNLAKSNVGSPIYSAPEQHLSNYQQTYAVDIWSLGTILYEMVTGKKAFPAEDQEDLKLLWQKGFNNLK